MVLDAWTQYGTSGSHCCFYGRMNLFNNKNRFAARCCGVKYRYILLSHSLLSLPCHIFVVKASKIHVIVDFSILANQKNLKKKITSSTTLLPNIIDYMWSGGKIKSYKKHKFTNNQSRSLLFFK